MKRQDTLRADKISVMKGIVAAWAFSGVFIFAGYNSLPNLVDISALRLSSALSFALLCAAVSLAAGIGRAAIMRHGSRYIDGSAPEPNSPLDITLRYIQNTAEQALLFIIACAVSALVMPDISVRILPILGLWFLIARALFWAGYILSPTKRAIGFASTFHPTLVLLAVCAYKLFTG